MTFDHRAPAPAQTPIENATVTAAPLPVTQGVWQTSTDEPLSPPLMLGLTLAGVGLLLLLLRPVRHA